MRWGADLPHAFRSACPVRRRSVSFITFADMRAEERSHQSAHRTGGSAPTVTVRYGTENPEVSVAPFCAETHSEQGCSELGERTPVAFHICYQLTLEAGDFLVVDNRRVAHDRTAPVLLMWQNPCSRLNVSSLAGFRGRLREIFRALVRSGSYTAGRRAVCGGS